MAYVVATFLAFPHPIGDRVVDLGPFVSWLAPAFLWLGLEGLGVRRATALGFLAGWAAHTAILHWSCIVTVVYGHAPVAAGWIAPPALALYIAAFPALFAAVSRALPDHPWARPLLAAAAWATACSSSALLASGTFA